MYGIQFISKKSRGGPVDGPGTAVSDSIKKQVEPGSFIMPADSTAKLGLNAEVAKAYKADQSESLPGLGLPGYGKKVPVNLSNGEHELTPEQVHAVGVQALNQIKSATHTPAGPSRLGVMRRAEASGKEQFFADGGLVMDPEKLPRLGVRSSAQSANLTPQGVRRMAKDAASVPGSGYGIKSAKQSGATELPGYGVFKGARDAAGRVADFNMGTFKAAAGAVSTPAALGLDKGRQLLARATDSTLKPEQETYFQDKIGPSLIRAGVEQRHRAFDGVKDLVAGAIGATPNAPEANASSPAQASAPNAAQPRTVGKGAVSQADGGAGQRATQAAGNGYTQVGNGIAMRTSTGGVPEFTNEATALSGAGAMPAGGIGRVGDGVGGGLSVGDPGDAQLAIERFGRANEIRAEAIAARPREAGDTGRVTVIEDSSRAPTYKDRARAAIDSQRAQSDAMRARARQGEAQTNQGIALDQQRMQTEQLNQQRLQQELATGQYAMQDRERIAALQARMVDPSLSEAERSSAREAYTSLTTPAKDRYIAQDVVMGQGNNGPVIGRQIIDATTGKPVAADAGQTQRRSSVTRAEIEQAAKEDGVSVDDYIGELRALGVTIG
jgi:hypothetical protein